MSAQEPVFDAIKRRRVCRSFGDQPVSHEDLEHLLWAARWAPSGGNQRMHHFIAIEDMPTIDLISAVSPGMLTGPAALVVICTDFDKIQEERINPARDRVYLMDVGSAAQNMMLAALERGLGTCPTTSFSHAAVRTILNLPQQMEPEYILQVGVPRPETRVLRSGVTTKLKLETISRWGAFPEADAIQPNNVQI